MFDVYTFYKNNKDYALSTSVTSKQRRNLHDSSSQDWQLVFIWGDENLQVPK